jgi:glycosyltransferase involved in cell wall biosynthesis
VGYRSLKVAIVHDWLVNYGGAERCLEALCEIWPQADLFTIVFKPELFRDSIISECDVHSSFVQRLPLARSKYRYYFFLFPFAVEQYDLRKYDVVVSLSAGFSHGVLTRSDQLHICYKHTPMRYAWSGYFEYLDDPHIVSWWRNWLARYVIHRIRRWDYLAAQRPDFLIANSREVQQRIWKYYRRESVVINPPVEVSGISLTGDGRKEDYYLTISRMVPYKKIDVIVRAFREMPNHRLVVAGTGPEMTKIGKLSHGCSNIELVGFVDENRKFDLLRKARAFIFAAHEDFGIVPIEAQACGTPVIAFGKGGALETIIEGRTGLFFNECTVDSLKDAVARFLKVEDSLDAGLIHNHTKKFDKKIFQRKFKQFVEEKIKG